MSRTIMDFRVPGDVWPFIDQWAPAAGFHMVAGAAPMKLYQKGYGFWVAPIMVSFQQSGDVIHMEAWMRSNFIIRLGSLFILPKEMELRSGGFKGALPRKWGREAINKLLEQLKLPLIP